jgi:hypothetical protein
MVLAACGSTPSDTEPVSEQDAPTAVPTENIEPTPTVLVEETATAVPPSPNETESNPLTYTNNEYGFGLQYPATWTVADVNDENFVGPGSHSVQFSQGTNQLIIGYRPAGEESMIFGTGIPAGELETQGTISVAGQDVERIVLVSNGKVKTVFYGQPGSVISTNGLEFAISLADFAQIDYEDIELTQQLQDEADLILSSLTMSDQ